MPKLYGALTLISMSWLVAPVTLAFTGNDAISLCVDNSETTYAKKQCEKKHKGLTLEFEGEVRDVIDEKKLRIMIDSSNYAEVVFKNIVADKVNKGDVVKFRGRITSFGTGILISHDIKDAVLSQGQPQPCSLIRLDCK